MEYAQLDELGYTANQIPSQSNIIWDSSNYCTAEALVRDGKADQFRIVPLTAVEPPDFNPITQKCFRDGCEKLGDSWYYKWTVIDLSTEEAAANQAAADKKLLDNIIKTVEQRLDIFAQSRGYDSILSACSYATSTVPKFAAEGQYCLTQRDATWNILQNILQAVEAKTRPVPVSYAEVDAELPPLVWPA